MRDHALHDVKGPLLVILSMTLFACVGGQLVGGEPHGWWAERGACW